jgi:hypothetical protein
MTCRGHRIEPILSINLNILNKLCISIVKGIISNFYANVSCRSNKKKTLFARIGMKLNIRWLYEQFIV